MLWMLRLEFLNSEEMLLGLHLKYAEDPLYKVPFFTTTIGLVFMNITFSVGKKKRES